MPTVTQPSDDDIQIIKDLLKRVRRLELRPAGSFDPNEDPILIGSGATAGSGSTPSSPSAGVSGAVVLGLNAEADTTSGSKSGVAIGNGAKAYVDNGIAIGQNAQAASADCVAIGDSSAPSSKSVAIGSNANTNQDCVAVGYNNDTQGRSKAILVGSGAVIASGILGPTGNSFPGAVAIGYAATVGASGDYADGAVAVGALAYALYRSVAVGHEAAASAHESLAVGYSSVAGGIQSIAIGYGTLVQASGGHSPDNSIAIGDNAGGTKCNNSVAVGSNAVFDSGLGGLTGMTAVGASAGARADYATAIGYGANATVAHTIVLGRSTETVVMPGNFDASALPTTNPGAGSGLVWNNSGVLTVA